MVKSLNFKVVYYTKIIRKVFKNCIPTAEDKVKKKIIVLIKTENKAKKEHKNEMTASAYCS